MLRLVAVLIAALLLTAGAEISAPLKPSPPLKGQAVSPQKANSDTASQQRGTKESPLFVETHVSGKLDAASENAGLEAQDEHNPWRDPITIFTGLLVLVGASQVWFLRNTDKATTKAANAAKASADAVVSQLRSYLQIRLEITGIDEPGPRVVTGELRNTGQTPAFDISHWTAIGCDKWPTEMTFDKPSVIVGGSKFTLGPTEKSHFGPSLQLSDAQISGLKAGDLALFVWGRVEYRDAFDQPRWLTYRRVQGGRFGFNEKKLAYMETGNDSN
jgi:hypothetical protein